MYNGYTPATPYGTRIQNLLYNIPVTARPKAIADAWTAAKQEIENANKFDFERHLTAIVRRAQSMENEKAEHEDWLDNLRTMEEARY